MRFSLLVAASVGFRTAVALPVDHVVPASQPSLAARSRTPPVNANLGSGQEFTYVDSNTEHNVLQGGDPAVLETADITHQHDPSLPVKQLLGTSAGVSGAHIGSLSARRPITGVLLGQPVNIDLDGPSALSFDGSDLRQLKDIGLGGVLDVHENTQVLDETLNDALIARRQIEPLEVEGLTSSDRAVGLDYHAIKNVDGSVVVNKLQGGLLTHTNGAHIDHRIIPTLLSGTDSQKLTNVQLLPHHGTPLLASINLGTPAGPKIKLVVNKLKGRLEDALVVPAGSAVRIDDVLANAQHLDVPAILNGDFSSVAVLANDVTDDVSNVDDYNLDKTVHNLGLDEAGLPQVPGRRRV